MRKISLLLGILTFTLACVFNRYTLIAATGNVSVLSWDLVDSNKHLDFSSTSKYSLYIDYA